MRALVPLNNKEHIDDYIQAGAEEFYIGFYDDKWHEQFGEYGDINRLTGFKKTANPYDFNEMLDIVKLIKQKGAMIYITFNASIYSQAMLDKIETYLLPIKEAGADGVIVSCAELVTKAADAGIPVVVSTISGVYNSDLVRFYKDLGAKRIILPRDLSIDEIESITSKVQDVEYEIFMMRNGCRFSDAHCLGFHRLEMPSICSFIGRANREVGLEHEKFKERHDAELNDQVYTTHFHNNACGLCSIYRFVQMGITAGKIVGRSDEWQDICRDISLLEENVKIAKACHNEEEYLERMILPQDRVRMCKSGLSCYYPEVRF